MDVILLYMRKPITDWEESCSHGVHKVPLLQVHCTSTRYWQILDLGAYILHEINNVEQFLKRSVFYTKHASHITPG